jgi:hypothetical protein
VPKVVAWFLSLFVVDIKELKLLGGFDHPNIVRFVSAFIAP